MHYLHLAMTIAAHPPSTRAAKNVDACVPLSNAAGIPTPAAMGSQLKIRCAAAMGRCSCKGENTAGAAAGSSGRAMRVLVWTA